MGITKNRPLNAYCKISLNNNRNSTHDDKCYRKKRINLEQQRQPLTLKINNSRFKPIKSRPVASYTVFHKKVQYICDQNSEKTHSLLIIFALLSAGRKISHIHK